MPVIPSFASFGPKPNLAGAFNQGAEIALSAQRAAAQIALEKQKMAQSAAAAEAQYAQRAEIAAADAARQAHRDEVERAYRMAEYGMKQRQLENADKQLKLVADEAARKYASEQMYRKRFSELYAATGDAAQSSRQAMLEIDPSLFGGAGTQAMTPLAQGKTQHQLGERIDLQSPYYEGRATGPNSMQIINLSKYGDQPGFTPSQLAALANSATVYADPTLRSNVVYQLKQRLTPTTKTNTVPEWQDYNGKYKYRVQNPTPQ